MKSFASIRSLIFASIAAASVAPLHAQFDPNNPIPAVIPHGPVRVDLHTAASDLIAPNFLVSAPDGSKRLFIIDQPGQIWIVKNGTRLATPFLDVSARMVTLSPAYDERGLLGFAFDPQFTNEESPGFRRVFTYSSEPVSGTADLTDPYATSLNHHGVIASWKVSEANPDVVDPETRVEILRVDEPQSNHNGGTIAFGPDGFLYIGLGDGGGANDNNPNGHNPTIGNGQDPTIALGKMLRIDVNGTNSSNGKYGIPVDNPFATSGGVREIFALGFRNPFRFGFDGTDLLVADVGQNKIEELDRVEIGKNYGWRYKEGTFKFNTDGSVSDDLTGLPAGLTDPIFQYDHDEGISIIGGYVYRGNAIPALRGKYIFGDFSKSFLSPTGRLFYADLTTGEIRELILGNSDVSLGLFIKGMGVDADGEIYVLASVTLGPSKDVTNKATGVAIKLVPPAVFSTGAPVPFAGVLNSGVPADAVFKDFGAPSINDSSEIAFAALFTSQEGNRSVIVGPKPDDRSTSAVIAAQGSPATDETGTALPGGEIFASFGDPVLNSEGHVAFVAKLTADPQVPGSRDTGLWSDAGDILHLVAREGSEAPGATGATFKKFTSIALGSSSGGESLLAFVASLAKAGPGTDVGLWFAQRTASPELIIREGQSVSFGGSDHKLQSLQALAILKGAPGQGNGVADSSVLALAKFKDGAQAILRAAGAAGVTVVAATGDAQLDATLKAFSSTTQSTSAKAAFIASLQGASKPTNAAAFIENDDATQTAIAREGDAAPGTDGVFSAIGTIVRRSDGDALVQATIKGGTTIGSTNTGLWWRKGGVLTLLAREGFAAPVDGGLWQSFQSIALPDGAVSAPIFTGTLRPKETIDPRNNLGLWAANLAGELQLVLRTGDTFQIDAQTKTLRSFTVLSIVPGSPAQTRSFNSNRELIYRALFTDGSKAILTKDLP